MSDQLRLFNCIIRKLINIISTCLAKAGYKRTEITRKLNY